MPRKMARKNPWTFCDVMLLKREGSIFESTAAPTRRTSHIAVETMTALSIWFLNGNLPSNALKRPPATTPKIAPAMAKETRLCKKLPSNGKAQVTLFTAIATQPQMTPAAMLRTNFLIIPLSC